MNWLSILIHALIASSVFFAVFVLAGRIIHYQTMDDPAKSQNFSLKIDHIKHTLDGILSFLGFITAFLAAILAVLITR